MPFYDPFYSAQMGQDNEISSFNVMYEEGEELPQHKECPNSEDIYSSFAASNVSNNGQPPMSHSNSDYDQMPATGSYESRSLVCVDYPNHSRQSEGKSDQNGNWNHDDGERNEEGLISSPASSFSIPPLDFGEVGSNITNYENVHNNAITSTSLDFAVPSASTFAQSTYDE
jgi:hypothetical protein